METRVLLVEDDDRARELLADVLAGAGYQVTTAASGEVALELLERQDVDVVVTDINMRRVDGVQVLEAAREKPWPPHVILLTGFSSLETSIAALRAGAHDYLLKPCSPPDLLACVARAVQRRAAEIRQASALQSIAQGLAQLRQLEPDSTPTPAAPPSTAEAPERFLRIGALLIDCFRHAISFRGEALHVTPLEYALLRCLAEDEGRVIGYAEIVRRTHGHTVEETEAHTLLKAHVRNLRRKLDPAYLVNVRGTGYMLTAPEGT
jgi:two-component system, OmpR family, response regulator